MDRMGKMDKMDKMDKIAQSVGSNRAYPQDQNQMRKESLHQSGALVHIASLLLRGFQW